MCCLVSSKFDTFQDPLYLDPFSLTYGTSFWGCFNNRFDEFNFYGIWDGHLIINYLMIDGEK